MGKRFGQGKNKPLVMLGGRPLLAWALAALNEVEEIGEIIPVLKEQDMAAVERLIERFSISKVKRIAAGGKERQDSVMNGLKLVSIGGSGGGKTAIVLVHDGVRPFVQGSLIRDVIAGLSGFAGFAGADGFDGAVAGVPVTDTIKEADAGGFIKKTLDRKALWAIQTPQVFYFEKLMSAYERAESERFYSTDDSALIERYGGKVRIVMGSYGNIKITTPEDIKVAETLLKGVIDPSSGSQTPK